MRALIVLVVIGGTAMAAPLLPTPTDQAVSTKQAQDAWTLFSRCSPPKDCIATWRRAVAIDPSNVEIRMSLAEQYFTAGDTVAALAIIQQLEASACQECLRALIKSSGGRAWASDMKFSAEVAKGIHGRHTKFSAAAETVIDALETGDWAKLRPFVPKKGVRWEPDSGLLAPAQLKAIVDSVHEERNTIRTSGLTTCEGNCCFEIWDMLGGDTPMYLEGMCFAPGPVLVSLSWDSLR